MPTESPAAAVAEPPARPPGRFWNVPNTLTVSRLGLSIFVFAAISAEWYGWAFGLFVAAAASDALDGFFARLLSQSTPLGRQLDPLIDKVIVAGAYIYLAAIPGTGVFPWMVTAIVVRELLIQGLRSLLEGQGQAFGAKTVGKLKTLFQCLSVSGVLYVLWRGEVSPNLLMLRDAFTWIAVALTIYSGVIYLSSAGPALRGEATRES